MENTAKVLKNETVVGDEKGRIYYVVVTDKNVQNLPVVPVAEFGKTLGGIWCQNLKRAYELLQEMICIVNGANNFAYLVSMSANNAKGKELIDQDLVYIENPSDAVKVSIKSITDCSAGQTRIVKQR
jgi:hypothetical protein